MKLVFLLLLSIAALAQEPKKTIELTVGEESQFVTQPEFTQEGVTAKEILQEKEKLVRRGNEGGGGDPIAAEFSSLASYLAGYLEQNPLVSPQISRAILSALAQEIKDSLHVSSQNGVIEVDEAETGSERPPFLEANRSPLYVKISRPQWSRLDKAGRLKATRTMLLDLLSRLGQEDEIPLPENSLKTYTEQYGVCVKWTEIVRSAFETYDRVLTKCKNSSGHVFSSHEKKLRDMIVKNVPQCVQACELSGQKLSGVEICRGYLEQTSQLLDVRGKQNPLCIGQ